jgi:hypothetical protein
MTQDTVVAVVDSLKPVYDSVAHAIGADAGQVIGVELVAVLGLVTKLVTEPVKLGITKFKALNPIVKSVVALVVAQVITFANAKAQVIGMPGLPTDVTLLDTAVPGLVVWLAAMGYNSGKDAVLKKLGNK